MTTPSNTQIEGPRKTPRRRIEASIRISADSWDDLRRELNHLATEIASHGMLSKWSVSGGYSTGHIIETSEDETITHDSWAEENEAYCRSLKDTSS